MAQHNWSHIQAVLQDRGFRCTLLDRSEDIGMISIQGPKRCRIPGRCVLGRGVS